MTETGPFKQISIDELIPGMYIVAVDVPWYRTPFLSHKRLVKDAATIDTMRQCGIRTVTIDPRKGKDVEAPAPVDPVAYTTVDRPPEPDLTAAVLAPLEQARTAGAFYTAAEEAVERIFDQLTLGGSSTSAMAKAVVSNVLTWMVNDEKAMLAQVAFRKMIQFDRSLASHALDTSILSLALAVVYGLDRATQLLLGIGALLHDVGYLQLPRNLVRRREEVTEQELVLLRQHPKLGLSVLAQWADCHEEVKRIVFEHHERVDGSGFPKGHKRDAISNLAQIVGLVDSYDGMVSRRGGRPAMLLHDAVRRLYASGERGEFDSAFVETLIRCVGVFPPGSLVLLNTGEQAIVIGNNPGQGLKPEVLIVKGAHGESYPNPWRVNLADRSDDREGRVILRALDPVRERINVALYLNGEPPQAA